MKELYTVYVRKSQEKKDGRFVYPVENKGRFQTKEQAQSLADIINTAGSSATVGKYFIYSREDWKKDQYKSKSITNTDQLIWGEHGTMLIFEWLHFDIEGRKPCKY